jgi:hypothetical protein
MPQPAPPAFERLQAELIRCMNRYTSSPDPGTAGAVAELLQGILEHPLVDLFPELRGQCARGLNQWRTLAVLESGTGAVAPSLH